MKLALASHQKVENFFREYFANKELCLSHFHIYSGFWARLITKTFKLNGITLGKHVFIDPAFVTRDAETGLLIAPFKLIVHEATHVLQYQRLGFLGFLFSYLKEWFAFIRLRQSSDLETRWQAYYAISHETEARDAAEAYTLWNEKSKIKNAK
jgi:hypothetical protein